MNRNNKKKSLKTGKVNPNSIKEFKVKEECELLDFLLQKYPQLSRNAVKSLLSNHQVSVDGAPVSQYNLKLAKEDVVIVSKRRISKKERGHLPIIYEDDEFIVINKPSGLLTVPSDNEKDVRLLICTESEDTARLIGKKGMVASALREIISVAGKNENKHIHLSFESFDEDK